MSVAFAGPDARVKARPIFIVLTVATLGAAAYYFVRGYTADAGITALADFALYRDAADRWLHGESFYLARQLAGPYDVKIGDVLYPPPVLLLLVPVAIVATPVAILAWWGIPALIVATSLARLRPAAWSWPLLALTLWWPATLDRIATGNPLIWMTAFLYAGAAVHGPSALVLLKPTLAPFAFFRANNRAWGIVALGVVGASLLFLPMWFEYATVIGNLRSFAGPGYSLEEFPPLLGAVVAFVGRQTQQGEPQPELAQSPVEGRAR